MEATFSKKLGEETPLSDKVGEGIGVKGGKNVEENPSFVLTLSEESIGTRDEVGGVALDGPSSDDRCYQDCIHDSDLESSERGQILETHAKREVDVDKHDATQNVQDRVHEPACCSKSENVIELTANQEISETTLPKITDADRHAVTNIGDETLEDSDPYIVAEVAAAALIVDETFSKSSEDYYSVLLVRVFGAGFRALQSLSLPHGTRWSSCFINTCYCPY